ncbi:FCD domain-containing protein [Pluralibacter gergoviae]|uniref:FCD domain-containing protein n=1 Tax=Pluralibacter gergoviae TaxID=61647 RepID=A0AAI9GM13_PLUGE|nr:FCD domain-containing protein [Pluralibacter gergoviae]EKV0918218.1 FCD domain-containing protein [Pluralibacter gergoviae]EKV0929861.1 FCD domain-containing protein [Pluralibacter gergoviae]EKV6247243.1 FCD domain-containing protein [Pluralibacter gergoviae]EKV9909079.1 FCD domain-containing protein [Pluralibacter gergoviae]EKW6617433.1 FCD domain-containing protein [Pluralibacter gergoviae]
MIETKSKKNPSFTLAASGAGAGGQKKAAPLSGKTLVLATYERLRNDIIAGVLAPGSRLRVEHLKEVYEAGAGTLREALALLVSDALVNTYGQRGFWVKPISLEDFADLTEKRILLETDALRLSLKNGDDDWEAELVSAYYRLSKAEARLDGSAGAFEEWEVCNRLFHEAALSACGSRWSHYFLSILYHQTERYRRLMITEHPVPRDVHHEHEAIYSACIARDAEAACASLAAHIQANYSAISRLPESVFRPSEE